MSRLFQFSLMTIAYEVLNDFFVKKKKTDYLRDFELTQRIKMIN